MERLNVLLFTRDARALVALQAILRELDVFVDVHIDEVKAVAMAMRRHFDGFMVDYDDGAAAKALISGIRAASSNRLSPIVLLAHGNTSLLWARDLGMNIVFGLPISIPDLRPSLRAALLSMTREHLRYSRHQIAGPAFIACTDHRTFDAETMNLSSEGLALRLAHPSKLSPTVRVRFRLPLSDPTIIEANARVAWSDHQARVGIHFHHLAESSRQHVHNYLAELHSRDNADLSHHGTS